MTTRSARQARGAEATEATEAMGTPEAEDVAQTEVTPDQAEAMDGALRRGRGREETENSAQ
jgi:hypothetical protein